MSNYELKSKSYMLAWCSLCVFSLCERCLFEKRGKGRGAGADWQQMLFCARTDGGSIIPRKGSCRNSFASHCSFSFHPFPHPHSLFSPSTVSSITFSLYACRSLTPFACTCPRTQTHTHTVKGIHKHTQRDPRKCEVILTLIHPLNYELQCV